MLTSIPISVIVPVYNAEKTLRQCLDSILSQQFPFFEILLIDDGSKDLSPLICDEYAQKDNRIKVFHQKNCGVSSARNVGLDVAQGEWVTFIDSDDEITNDFFNDVISCEEDLLLRGFVAFSNGECIGGCNPVELCDYKRIELFLDDYLNNSILRTPWGKFYKRELIGAIRFLSDMKIGEDVYFVLRYLANCKTLAFLRGGGYLFRVSEIPDVVKYRISVDYAVHCLQYIKDAYDSLVCRHGIDKKNFLSYIYFYKRLSNHDKHDRYLWYNNPQVRELYDYVLPALTCRQRLKIQCQYLLKL